MKDFSMLFLHRYAFILSIICLGGIDGFVTQPLAASFRSHTNQEHGSFSLWMITDQAIVEEIASARFAFGLCFFGAAGVGSIGRELIPIVFGRFQFNRGLSSGAALKFDDNSQDLGIWGYPEKIYKSEVQAILNNPLGADAIARKFPIESIDGSEKRYEYTHIPKPVFLSYDAYVLANPRANPVALRALFDAFSNSIGGSNAVSTIIAQERIDLYKQDVKKITQKLNSGKLIGIAAFLLVLVLLGVADYLAIYHIWRGWFPEWQGFSNMPESLFSKEMGIFVLPEYFISDLPKLSL